MINARLDLNLEKKLTILLLVKQLHYMEHLYKYCILSVSLWDKRKE